ncbi:MAG: hypothetical protein JXR25_04610 [Pontiellaceae bacterium]|nr:hypothetical protein [Pontiellaceae bacterium]MBN2784087.1 hypothetical protein [Pontiellaceae bacterium]
MSKRIDSEDAVRQAATVKLVEDEGFDVIGCEGLEVYEVGVMRLRISVRYTGGK